jgi:hypothetical protein
MLKPTKMSKFLLLIVSIAIQTIAIAQTTNSQQMAATRTNLPIKIDGEITDEAWKTASIATNFIEQRPTFGSVENEKTKR